MDREEVEVHKQAITEGGQHPAILAEQVWSIKDLLCGNNGGNNTANLRENRGQFRASKIGPSSPLE